jgi:hypothetical protein
MARKSGAIRTGETIVARGAGSGVGAANTVLAIDNATLSDANYPAVSGKLTGAIDCTGYDTIMVGLEVDVPGTSTGIIEALFFDPDGAVDQKLSRDMLGAAPGVTATALAAEKTPALPGVASQYAELRVHGHPQVFLRMDTVANTVATTGYKILVRPGRVRGDRALNRS